MNTASLCAWTNVSCKFLFSIRILGASRGTYLHPLSASLGKKNVNIKGEKTRWSCTSSFIFLFCLPLHLSHYKFLQQPRKPNCIVTISHLMCPGQNRNPYPWQAETPRPFGLRVLSFTNQVVRSKTGFREAGICLTAKSENWDSFVQQSSWIRTERTCSISCELFL